MLSLTIGQFLACPQCTLYYSTTKINFRINDDRASAAVCSGWADGWGGHFKNPAKNWPGSVPITSGWFCTEKFSTPIFEKVPRNSIFLSFFIIKIFRISVQNHPLDIGTDPGPSWSWFLECLPQPSVRPLQAAAEAPSSSAPLLLLPGNRRFPATNSPGKTQWLWS